MTFFCYDHINRIRNNDINKYLLNGCFMLIQVCKNNKKHNPNFNLSTYDHYQQQEKESQTNITSLKESQILEAKAPFST